MDPAFQQQTLPHFPSFPQETPIKASQVPNLLSHPPPRRILPLQTPEECNKKEFSPNWPPGRLQYQSTLVPISLTNIVSPVNSLIKDRVGPIKHISASPGHGESSPVNSVTTARDNQGPQHHTIHPGPEHLNSSQVVSASLTKNNTSTEKSSIPTIFQSPSPHSGKNLTNHSRYSLARRVQETESKLVSSKAGKTTDVSKTQQPNESQPHEQTRSSKSAFPVMDLNSAAQKRRREGEPCFKNTKKPCLKGSNHGTTEMRKPPAASQRPSLEPQRTPKSSSVLELSPETTDRLLKSEPTRSALSSTLKPSRLNLICSKKTQAAGVKQFFITTENNVVKLKLTSTLSQDGPNKRNEESHKKDKSNSSKGHAKECSKHPPGGPVCSNSDHTDCNTLVKTEDKKLDDISPKPASEPSLGSLSCSKGSHVRRPVVVLDDIDQLFTPDPNVYVVRHACKASKSKMDDQMIKSPTSKKGSSPTSSCSPTVTPVTQLSAIASAPASKLALRLPTLALERIKLDGSKLCSKDKGIRNTQANSSGRQPKDKNNKPQHNLSVKPKTNNSCSETETAASVKGASSPFTQSPPLQEEESEGSKEVKEEDSIDVELDLGLSISYDIDPTQSSESSEEEPLISFQEMMERVTKPPDTPQKEAFSEPSTPGRRSSQSKTCLLTSTAKPGVYKNNLDQMLKEINNSKKAKEIETQLLTACNEDLLRLAECEEEEENQGEITTEHQEFLQHFSLMSAAIREIAPGEVIFNLEKFGQIFHQDTLQLRQCLVNPQGTSQKTLLWSSPAQLKLLLNIGLFEEAYCSSPCPAQVTRFLFKMMSVHSERIVSDKILQALCDIACSAAYQIVSKENQEFEVWVPSVADVTLVLMNMGAAFTTLFPFESLQPPFTEGDLLEDVHIKSETPFNNKEIVFPEHNCTNILKYLSYCAGLCPLAYSDNELLLLLTLVGRISLETQRILQCSVEMSCLLYKMMNNIRDWSSMLPRVCKHLTDLTDDHHNMCLLVQLLPDSTRGKQLRRHLSMCFISKLLDGNCTYSPVDKEFQLAELRPYLPQMQPSALVQSIEQKDKEEDITTQDQQAYYLCYSLLTLTNEASNLQLFQPHQKAQLLVLSSELETHVKCDIRESEKCLYRSKVKDLVARIYTKWQMLLQRTRPLNGKLYDYWQPVETIRSTQEDEKEILIEDDEEESTTIDENDSVIVENEKTEVKEDMEALKHPADDEDGKSETKATGEQTVPLTQPPATDEKIYFATKECADMTNENAGGGENSPPDAIK